MRTIKPFKVVQEHLSKSMPDLLWHYTSYSGLVGILEGRKIWASEIRHLNDRLEFEHGRNLIEEEAASIEKAASVEKAEDDEQRLNNLILGLLRTDLAEGFYQPNNFDLFITSFSANKDQLSQWRGYCSRAQGVSLGFDLAHLRPPLDSNLFQYVAPCIYSDDEKRTIIQTCCNQMKEAASAWNTSIFEFFMQQTDIEKYNRIENLPDSLRKPLFDSGSSLGLSLLKMIALFKHRSFHEEAEWRFVGSPVPDPPNLKRFLRVSPTGLVPTVGLDLNRTDGSFPLKEIVVGPCPEPQLQIRAISKLLRWNGLADVVISHSVRSPYRVW